jgi:hypothetical protein
MPSAATHLTATNGYDFSNNVEGVYPTYSLSLPLSISISISLSHTRQLSAPGDTYVFIFEDATTSTANNSAALLTSYHSSRQEFVKLTGGQEHPQPACLFLLLVIWTLRSVLNRANPGAPRLRIWYLVHLVASIHPGRGKTRGREMEF